MFGEFNFTELSLSVLIAVFLGFFTSLFTAWTSLRRERSEKRLSELISETNPHLRVESVYQESSKANSGQASDLALDMARKQQERLAALSALGDSYHEQALGQARVQFRVSTVAASVGFILIIYGGFMQIASLPAQALDVVLGILPGAVIEGVAALFFAQAASTRHRATEFYSRLQDDQRSRQALEIADGIVEPNLKSLVYAQMALHIAGLATSELDVQSSLSKSSLENLKKEE